jgi:hypothetical protein
MNKKKVIIAVALNLLALVIILFNMGSTPEEKVLQSGRETGEKLIPVLMKSEIFEGSVASLTLGEVSFVEKKNPAYEVILNYTVDGHEDIQGMTVYLIGKLSDGSYTYDSVVQVYHYKDGSNESYAFDPSKDSGLIIK